MWIQFNDGVQIVLSPDCSMVEFTDVKGLTTRYTLGNGIQLLIIDLLNLLLMAIRFASASERKVGSCHYFFRFDEISKDFIIEHGTRKFISYFRI